MKEHRKDIRKFSGSSHVAQHSNETEHSFGFSNVETLAAENNWTRRIIKESLYTSETNGRAPNDSKFKLNMFS